MPDEGMNLGTTGPAQNTSAVTPAKGETDETTWRGRALEAEDKLKAAEEALAALRSELETTQQTLSAFQRRREVEQALIDARASDIESALLLVETALSKSPATPVTEAIADVKSRKPHLFAPPEPSARGVMGPGRDRAPSPLEDALDAARRAGGTRRSLLGYLRTKRGAR
jgi:hypothetical protein